MDFSKSLSNFFFVTSRQRQNTICLFPTFANLRTNMTNSLHHRMKHVVLYFYSSNTSNMTVLTYSFWRIRSICVGNSYNKYKNLVVKFDPKCAKNNACSTGSFNWKHHSREPQCWRNSRFVNTLTFLTMRMIENHHKANFA